MVSANRSKRAHRRRDVKTDKNDDVINKSNSRYLLNKDSQSETMKIEGICILCNLSLNTFFFLSLSKFRRSELRFDGMGAKLIF